MNDWGREGRWEGVQYAVHGTHYQELSHQFSYAVYHANNVPTTFSTPSLNRAKTPKNTLMLLRSPRLWLGILKKCQPWRSPPNWTGTCLLCTELCTWTKTCPPPPKKRNVHPRHHLHRQENTLRHYLCYHLLKMEKQRKMEVPRWTNAAVQTIQEICNTRLGLPSWSATKKPLLTEKMIKMRLAFCKTTKPGKRRTGKRSCSRIILHSRSLTWEPKMSKDCPWWAATSRSLPSPTSNTQPLWWCGAASAANGFLGPSSSSLQRRPWTVIITWLMRSSFASWRFIAPCTSSRTGLHAILGRRSWHSWGEEGLRDGLAGWLVQPQPHREIVGGHQEEA